MATDPSTLSEVIRESQHTHFNTEIIANIRLKAINAAKDAGNPNPIESTVG